MPEIQTLVIPGRHEVANPESRDVRVLVWIPDRRCRAVRNDKQGNRAPRNDEERRQPHPEEARASAASRRGQP